MSVATKLRESVQVYTTNVIVSDTFNRVDGALGTADTGQIWRIILGGVTVVSNQAKASSTAECVVLLDSGAQRPTVTCDQVYGAAQSMAIISSSDAAGANYLMGRVDNTTAYIFVKSANVFINGSTSAAIPFTTPSTQTVSMSVAGSVVSLYVGAVRVVTRTLTTAELTATTGTYCGVRSAGSLAGVWDNFSVSV